MKIAHPAQRAADDVAADLVGVGVGDVDALAPRVARRGQVGSEPRQVVARRAQVVEHRVDQHAQPLCVAGVDEAHQRVGAAVGFVHAVPQHPVVSPTVAAGKGIHRHQLDEVHAEVHQIVQLVDGGVEGPGAGERAQVQLVDYRPFDRPAGPPGVGPRHARRVPQLRAGVHALGLARGARVGQHGGIVVEQVPVAGGRRGVHARMPPAVPRARHGVHLALDVEPDPFGFGRPHPEVSHGVAPAARPAGRRTTGPPRSVRPRPPR